MTNIVPIEKLFDQFEKRFDDKFKAASEAFNEFKENLDEKTKLQATEYERRLEGLNNETGRVANVIEKTVSADTWTGFQKEFNELKERVTIEFSAANKAKTFLIILSVITTLISLATVITLILK